jgi:Cu/Ag efflux protein CusF
MKLTRILGALALLLASAAFAQTSSTDHAGHHAASAPTASMTDGEVRRIDKAQAKLTLRHGPIANLDMPRMTMVFQVADPRMLETLKEGDKVRFVADKVNGVYTVTAIEAVK